MASEKKKISENVSDETSDKANEDSWLVHKLSADTEEEVRAAKDANMRNDEDWFDIHDPRNPINKRRRDDSSREGSSRSSRDSSKAPRESSRSSKSRRH